MSIHLKDVDVALDGRAVLSAISLDLPSGCAVGLIGPNGAGKTTLLRAIAGLIPIAAGDVRVAGIDPTREPRRRVAEAVSLMPQSVELPFAHPSLDVVLMGGAARRGAFGFASESDLAAALQALERLEVAHVADTPITRLSGGERQRVLFAMQLVQAAKVALFDEPTSAQDFTGAARMARALRELAIGGVTVVAAVHDLNFAVRAFDRLILVRHGRVTAQGAPEDVLRSAALREAYGPEFELVDGADMPTVVPRTQPTVVPRAQPAAMNEAVSALPDPG